MKTDGFNIICGEAGLQGGFIAGALDQLLSDYPDIINRTRAITATSASVGTASYFLSHGVSHPGEEVWVKKLSDPKFSAGSAWSAYKDGRPIYDVDYLIDYVFHQCHPLNTKNIHNHPICATFPIFNRSTGELEYFRNREANDGEKLEGKTIRNFKDYDYYDVMRAAKAVPILYDRSVRLGASEYIDAGQFEPYTIHAPETRGLKKILITTKYTADLLDRLRYYTAGLTSCVLSGCSDYLQHNPSVYWSIARKPSVYNVLGKEVDALVACGDLLLIVPEKKMPNSSSNSLQMLTDNYMAGRNVVRKNAKRINQFASEPMRYK